MQLKVFKKDIETKDVQKYIHRAYRDLLKNERFLFEHNLSERAITHRLAFYLEKYFPSYYNIDCEYNRDGLGERPKYLNNLKEKIGKAQPDELDAKTVFPDIIVHARGNELISWVVIEAKKLNNNQAYDERKLHAFKDQLGYKHAFLISFPSSKKEYKNASLKQLIKEI